MKGRWYILLAAWVGSMLATLPAQGQDEEENTYGRDLVVQRCSECHTLKRVFRANYDRSGWSDATGRMMDQGLMVEEEERAAIIDFLLSQKEQRPLLEQVGMLHFVLIHLPIALLLVVGLFEGLALWRRGSRPRVWPERWRWLSESAFRISRKARQYRFPCAERECHG